MHKIKNWGQIYTPEHIVKLLFDLSRNGGSILEPSAGTGQITDYIYRNSIRSVISIEIDKANPRLDFFYLDFFDFNEKYKFRTIISNPPYVSFQNILSETLDKIKTKSYLKNFNDRTNLYLFFIRKCIEHLETGGESILITPRDFIKATSAIELNNFLYQSGTITDWYEFGDNPVFEGYKPNVAIWRFEKDNFSRMTNTNSGKKIFSVLNGQIFFTFNKLEVRLGDLFSVRVGAASGFDSAFESNEGNLEFVCSYTKKTNKLRRMIYNVNLPILSLFKEKLLARRIKRFDDSNWWMWGRGFYESSEERIYVNCKTRDKEPFFTHSCKNYDGSILALFPKSKMDISTSIRILNGIDWNELGFLVGDRLCFSQKSLENCYLPKIEFN